jgi:hypothetical protein
VVPATHSQVYQMLWNWTSEKTIGIFLSAVGALEGANFKKTGRLPTLSEQNLVDCIYGTGGCDGTWAL